MADPFAVTLKSAVNTRALLCDRLPRKKPTDERVPSSTALHHSIHTTYDEAYGSIPARTDLSDTNRYLTLLRNRYASCNELGESRPAPVQGKITASSIHALRKPREADLVSVRHEPSAWVSEQHASTLNVQPTQCHNFFSTARRIERIDDDNRGGLVGNTQRTVDINYKRMMNPDLCPPPDRFNTFRPQRPPKFTDEIGRPLRSCLDIVDCTQLVPLTEEQMGYEAGPIERLPDATSLSQALPTQQRVITRLGTSRPLFAGTAKVHEPALPLYGGYVPAHAENVAKVRGNDEDAVRVWSKSSMTLAEHGGGVDAGYRCKNPLIRRRGGTRAPAAKELKPRSVENIALTVEGSMLQAPHLHTTVGERSLNCRADKNERIFR